MAATTTPSPARPAPAAAPTQPRWKTYGTPAAAVLLALAILLTLTRNWNSWEGGKVEQVTDDAYVRGDLTPLSTKVAGIVREVKVSDYQQVHKGDLLIDLEDSDYQAQVSQASAAVEAAKAAIENNHRQRELQQTRIERAIAGIDQANADTAAAEAGKSAVQADVLRTTEEIQRQQALYQTRSTTQQKVEQATADEQRFGAQLASREADLNKAKTLLHSSKLATVAERQTNTVLESQEQQLIADLHAKEAALTLAEVNLGYTKIKAPADGTVGARQVRPGQLVSPGTQVIPFVDRSRWIEANYRETQLTNIKVGDAAEVTIDAYPGKTFKGRVIEIAPASGSQFSLLPPDNATGNFTKVVQRIPVKILLDDPAAISKLRPGFSVVATVRTRK